MEASTRQGTVPRPEDTEPSPVLQIFSLLKNDGKMTQKKLAEQIGKSDRTVKHITVALEGKGLIERIGGKRFGYWKVNAE